MAKNIYKNVDIIAFDESIEKLKQKRSELIERIQLECTHIKVAEQAGGSRIGGGYKGATRICLECGLEEESSYSKFSILTTEFVKQVDEIYEYRF